MDAFAQCAEAHVRACGFARGGKSQDGSKFSPGFVILLQVVQVE